MLADIGGEPLLVRTLRRAAQSGAASVVAAVDDDALAFAAAAAGFAVVKTGECDSGSARVAAAAAALQMPDETLLVNVQGDEPFIEAEIIRRVAELLAARPDCVCATAARKLHSAEEFTDEAAVKIVLAADETASYFSRAAVPHRRGGGAPPPEIARVHIGIYAMRAGTLRRWIALPPSPTEQAEQLEQLRFIWHGGKIAVLTADSDSFGIDTAADLARARAQAQVDDGGRT